MGITSIHVMSKSSSAHHFVMLASSSSLNPLRATALILTRSPASLAAWIPLRTWGKRPHRVTRANLSGSSVSSDTFTRRTPNRYRSWANLLNCEPFVVKVSSSKAPDVRWRDIASKKRMISRRTKGSPPVTRSFFTPILIKLLHRRSSSSKDKSSFFGKNSMFSDMQ